MRRMLASFSSSTLTTGILLAVFALQSASSCSKILETWMVRSRKAALFLVQESVRGNGKHQAYISSREGQSKTFSQQDVDSLIDRCFDGLFGVDTTLTPHFIVADFDNDGAPDLFVAVRRAKIVRIQDKSEPPFKFQDVIDPESPASAALKLTMGDLGRPKDGRFWVVLHNLHTGKVAQCPSKQRKFVLSFPGGKGISTIRVFHGKKLPFGTIGDAKEDEPPPELKGDAILLLDDQSYGEALYWDGSRYRWYPFNGDPR